MVGPMIQLEIGGQSITRISFDYQLEILLSNQVSAVITGLFSYRNSSGDSVDLSIGRGVASCAVVLESFGKEVASGTVTDDGGLHILLTDGSSFHIDPDSNYESWELNGERNASKIVSMPGGELAIWD